MAAPKKKPTSKKSASPASAADVKQRRQKEWRIQLPISELVVDVREVDTMDLATNGEIPEHLSRHVWEDIETITDGMKDKEIQEALANHKDLIHVVCCATLISPRCVLEDPGEDEITPDLLPYADREFLYRLACGNGGYAALARFHEAQTRALEAPQDREGVREPAIGDPGDPA